MSKIFAHAPAFILAAFLIMIGLQKFGAENVIFATIAERSGIALFEPLVRMATGVAELVAAAMLVLPRTRLYGALGAVAIIGGAIGFHLSPWLGVSVAMAPGAAPTPVLFFMAAGSFIVAVLVLMQTRAAKR
ncbi:MAG: DoxX family protein [Alphaproteobacteria bacterium]|nr:DoxX family protein [Alphaproteobacteria bacterium]